ncbi:diaminobutyrate--2-oxoglutarate transaminase [Actinomadura sp. NBRC 104425]|uniref:diaminobutyrate--2-oxoglutarate transaminase n=1 Tax=Actinomadura sp. NBRC 104425 TaxID=3032204 RepID=UPI0024A5EAEF|nr:diaminobutyrate--2-oxoglutarate transaminase [Actinomadura sp. NBRC 104425]GLZ10714.1 diaminobutyrate--2-oxoglutarate transaminase [Actinomadura sp. NBRC 104425]
MDVFARLESEVRGYCRGWPTVFTTAQGSHITDEDGKTYLDFFAGAGTLNYGHNDPGLKRRLLDYLASDAIVHSLDMYTAAKRRFLERFDEVVLRPRGLDYKVQFPGPAGNHAVEAALKLARKYTGRETVVSFTNAFHGMTLGALAVTGNSMKRTGAGVPLGHGVAMPYDNYLDGRTPDFLLFETMLEDSGSGLDKPAAVIVETVQGEGGVNTASAEWLRGLQDLCRRHDILLIVDDVQMGCGRTGPFFSFEEAGLTPDIVCLSKSLSGYGLPLAVTLLRRELDVWEPGEHNGTFRGFNPAMVTATGALEDYWADEGLEKQTRAKGEQVERALNEIALEHAGAVHSVRGRGLVWGLVMREPELAPKVCAEAFRRGLLMETSGPEGEVVKLLPPLTTTEADLAAGLEILADSVEAVRTAVTA